MPMMASAAIDAAHERNMMSFEMAADACRFTIDTPRR